MTARATRRSLISERTRAALQAARKKGTRLGSPIAAQAAAKARAARSTYARAASASARAVVRDVQASGVTTLKGIAAALQARGVRTPRGNVVWAPAPGETKSKIGKLYSVCPTDARQSRAAASVIHSAWTPAF